MEPWQERVVEEARELDEKIVALKGMILSQEFRSLPEEDRLLLKEQFIAMVGYQGILCKRIVRFQ